MSTFTPAPLHEGQTAQLDLGYTALPCAVVGFSGADLVLLCDGHVPVESLRPGHTSFVVFQVGEHTFALKADVRRGGQGNEVIARLLDPFRLGQRRQHSRAPFLFDVSLRPLDAEGNGIGSWAQTRTRDVSGGGLSVDRTPEIGDGEDFEMKIDLGPAQRTIEAQCLVTRATPEMLSFDFTQLPDSDRLLLAQFTFAYYRRRATR